MFPAVFNLSSINIAYVPQTNTAFAQNVAVGSVGTTQTIVQLQSNSAQVNQGK